MKLKKQLEYIWKFVQEKDLFNEDSKLILALSGGVDSQILGFVFKELYKNNYLKLKPEVLHIHHHTREKEEHQKDLDAIKTLELNVHIESIDIEKNSEHLLRIQRAKIFKRYHEEKKALILTAHHLDDSFEWSMMQFFKASSLKSIIGIPVKNQHLRKPFMCLSKNQISKLAKDFSIPFHKDSTNEDTHFERNYFRAEILPGIKKRYPNYLTHYIRRSEKLLAKLGENNNNFIKTPTYNLHLLDTPKGVLRNDIYDSIKKFSEKDRGELGKEVEKLLLAFENKKSGPMSFSGAVKAYIFKTFVLIGREQSFSLKSKNKKEMNYYQFKNYCSEKVLEKFDDFFIAVEKFPLAVKARHSITSDIPSSFILVETLNLLYRWEKEGKYKGKMLHFVDFS